jgi:D-xylose transport system ATP-binding protein
VTPQGAVRAEAPTSGADHTFLRLTGATKSYGAVRALADVDLELRAGEVTALVGDNGAGKSTLVKALAGVHELDAGEFVIDGRPVTITSPQDAVAQGIATVYQDLALCENLDVVANLYLGQEPRHDRGRFLDEEEMESHARRLLDELAVRTLASVRTPVAALSGGQRQTVAIARALLGTPRLMLLDEPTAALGVAQTAQVLDLIRRLRDRGLAVLVISHNLGDVFEVADRAVVLRLGRLAGDYRIADTSQDEIVAAITGADASKTERNDR